MLFPFHAMSNIEGAKKQLKDLDEYLTSRNIFYCLVGGSLLGCVKMQDIMPWDDDIDLIIDSDYMNQELVDHFKSLGAKVNINTLIQQYYRNKTCSITDVYIVMKDKVQIDIWPCNQHGNMLCDMLGNFALSDMIPLQRSCMSNFYVNVPKNPHTYLDRTYGPEWPHVVIKRFFKHSNKKVSKRYENKTRMD